MKFQEIDYHYDNIKPYFEGWYYKIANENMAIAVIVGICFEKENSHAFIQTLDTISNQSQYIKFDISEFKYDKYHFHISLKNNHFYKDHIVLSLNESVKIQGTVNFGIMTSIKTNQYMPTIMGPFSYLKNMECVHSIISLYHQCFVDLKINDTHFDTKAIGYIEKDRGHSFPKKYYWLQSNCYEESIGSLSFAIADIDLKITHFTGIIMTLMIEKKHYYFASYLGAHVKEVSKDYIHIRQFKYDIHLYIEHQQPYELKAPKFGKMDIVVLEELKANIRVEIYYNKKFKEVHNFKMGASEIYNY